MEDEARFLSTEELCHLLRAVFDENPDALFVKDVKGKYLLCNQAVARMVGKPVGEILGRDDTALFDAEGARRVMSRDRRVLETGVSETEEETLTAAGVTRTYRATKTPYQNAAGEVVGVIGICRDITERRQAEAALRQSEYTLRLVVDALPVAVQVMDLRGDIVVSNPACEQIWGHLITSGEKRYKSIKAWWHETQLPIEPSEWASIRALHKGEVSRNERIDIEGFDGEKRTILNSAIPIRDDEQEIMGAVIINEDITLRLRLEQQFLQSQKMEAVGHLAGGVAHDFNNLLTVIAGYGELLLQSLEPSDPNEELIQEILEAAEKARRLTQKLLAFSRRSVLNPKIVDLNQSVRESEKMLRRLIGEDILMSVQLEGSQCKVKVDPSQLEQALLNLCINARDAMPTGGRLLIRTTRESLPKGQVALVVSDSGEGIDLGIQERIFEPFFTTKSQGKGTGLGLATVYGFVQQSGGHIEVESRPGEGSKFSLYLPEVVEEMPSESHLMPLSGTVNLGREVILLVEDQEALRHMAARALTKIGYTVVQASDGLEALRIWQERNGEDIQLLLTDVVMPEMGGRQLAEKLLEFNPELKVVFMSGHTDDALLRHGVEQSQVAFLQKPFALDAMSRKIREVLDA